MKVGVKYCGGCNPKYDRKEIVKRMCRDYKNVFPVPVNKQDEYDLVLIICGCAAECFDYSMWIGRLETIELFQESDYKKIQEFFSKIEGD